MSTLITFTLAVGSVGLWTLRVALTARGSRILGSSVAAIEAVVFVVAFSHVTGSLNAPLQVGIYGVGVGAGTFLGLTIDRLLNGHRSRHGPAVEETDVLAVDGPDQEAVITFSTSPGTSSSWPDGVSSAQDTSPGDP